MRKSKYFSVFTDNDSFIFVIAGQKLHWTSANTELIQLELCKKQLSSSGL